ncbi:MAG: glycosyltransferase family 4 protein [Nocardioides sp.]|nr:glycosyltransferase family 4 protein [Nocardioides sp.]
MTEAEPAGMNPCSGMRVLFVTQWFPPEPATQALRIARALVDDGLATEVLTGIPNYPSGTVAEGYRAYSTLTEEVHGLTVHRTPLYPSHDASALRRIMNYVSWAVSSTCLGLRRMRWADAVLVYSSPATAALPAMMGRWLFGTPYVLLIQDVWPDSVFSSGFLPGRVSRLLWRLIEPFVNSAYRGASKIAVISPGMVDLLIARGVPRERLELVYNSVDTSAFHGADTPVTRDSLGIDESDLVLMYAGNHGAAQGLDALLRGVGAAAPERACHLVMVGRGVAKKNLMRLASEAADVRVHFVDAQPRESMAALMDLADVHVVSLAADGLFEVTMPSKFQTLLALARPVLALASGDVSTAVRDAGCGFVVRPGDTKAAAEAIEKLALLDSAQLAEMGARGRRYYDQNMGDPNGGGVLADLLRRASNGGRRSKTRDRRAAQ